MSFLKRIFKKKTKDKGPIPDYGICTDSSGEQYVYEMCTLSPEAKKRQDELFKNSRYDPETGILYI